MAINNSNSVNIVTLEGDLNSGGATPEADTTTSTTAEEAATVTITTTTAPATTTTTSIVGTKTNNESQAGPNDMEGVLPHDVVRPTTWSPQGAQIPFTSIPPPSNLNNYPMTPVQEEFITEQIKSLLLAGTIRVVSQAHNISPLGVVPKKNGKLRMILDLRLVNNYIQTPRFTMEDIRKVRPRLQAGDWATTID